MLKDDRVALALVDVGHPLAVDLLVLQLAVRLGSCHHCSSIRLGVCEFRLGFPGHPQDSRRQLRVDDRAGQ